MLSVFCVCCILPQKDHHFQEIPTQSHSSRDSEWQVLVADLDRNLGKEHKPNKKR